MAQKTTRTLASASVSAVHKQLRQAILRGELHPGDTLSSVQMAKRFGVSRTPLREALRMLQEEGLVQALVNRRARVAAFDADELELVYSSRLMLSSVGTLLTVPKMSIVDIEELKRLQIAMHEAALEGDNDRWQELDRSFHLQHVIHVPRALHRELETLYARASLYRRMWMRDRPYQLPSTDTEHEAIIRACAAGDAAAAVAHIARHLSKIALSLLADVAPEREPAVVRTAVQLVLRQACSAERGATPSNT